MHTERLYNFFQLYKKLYGDLGIKDMSECIYNLDETGLFLDPEKIEAFYHRIEECAVFGSF